MNKLLSIAAMTALLATAANADFMRIEGGVGAWETEPSGMITYGDLDPFDVANTAGFTATTNTYVWAFIKHPIPILPNFRIEYVDPSFSDKTKGALSYGDYEFSAGASNALSLTQYDAVLYYNLLDNLLWTTLDLGLDVKFIDGNYKVSGNANLEGVASGVQSYDEDFDMIVPLAYVRGRVQIPVINVGVEAIAKGITYSDNTVVDAEIKIDYTFEFIPVIHPALELGYRYQQMTLDSGSIGIKANIDTTFEGLYGGLVVRW